MPSTPVNKFPNYTEVPARIAAPVWMSLRIATLIVTGALIGLLLLKPDLGLKLFWGLAIPLLPATFALAPGLWRQICPMAFLNQLPRMAGFDSDRALPLRIKHLAFYLAMILFFVIVSLRHVFLNSEPALLGALLVAMLVAALVGGLVFKGRSGWCGTFCPLAPMQRTYGQAPIARVRNGYCSTCVGCQKNCYDFNPRAAIHSDLTDPDRWYSGHKEIFIGALPGFILAFFLAQAPSETGLIVYYGKFAFWMGLSLGLYMALTRLVWGTHYKAPLAFSMAALLIFYWFVVPTMLASISSLSGVSLPAATSSVVFALIGLIAGGVVFNGLRAERDFKSIDAKQAAREPVIEINAGALRTATSFESKSLVIDRGSGLNFVVDPNRSLLEGIESVGIQIDFGCRMGLCGADPIVVVEGADALSKPTQDELTTLHRLGLQGRARMACVCRPLRGGVVIDTKLNPRELPEPVLPKPTQDHAIAAGISRIVVIGNGAAGMTAAAEVRRLSPSCRIDVIAKESELFYNRMAIGRLLYGRSAMAGLHLMPADWHTKNNVTVWLNTIAVGLDLAGRTVRLGTGETVPYDRLLLAHGSSAIMPTIDGNALPGCFVLRDAADAMAVRAWRQRHPCRNAVVLGGGVLGVEAADALRHLDLNVTILQQASRLMDRQLDDRGSAVLTGFLQGLGLSVRTGASVARIVGEDRVRAIELSDGDRIPADIVVACVGVRPNIELAKAAGLTVNRGVVVDAEMRTSDANVFAAGDIAELRGTVNGLWAVSTNQACTAVNAMFGLEVAHPPARTLVNLKVDGIDVKAFGLCAPAHPAQELIQSVDASTSEHRMVIVEKGRIAGAVFVGPPGVGKFVADVIQHDLDVTPVINELRASRWDALGSLKNAATEGRP